MKKLFIIVVSVFLLSVTVNAETYEVKMLNRGPTGSMVFEPDYLAVQPGDTVKFIATHKSHNAASIPELTPENAPTFKGKINEEIEVTFDNSGVYGIQCVPHYSMGMIMVVKVGEAALPEVFKTYQAPGKSQQRLQDIINNNKL